MSIELSTWVKKRRFRYDGSVSQGTRIYYGKKGTYCVTSGQYTEMLRHFNGTEVPLGAIRNLEERPQESLGRWIADNVKTITTIVSYVAPILEHEGHCEHGAGTNVRFKHHG